MIPAGQGLKLEELKVKYNFSNNYYLELSGNVPVIVQCVSFKS